MKFYGTIGTLAYDPVEDKLQCHLCGRWHRGLSAHVVKVHGWTADDYREEFGLNRNQSLICEGTKERLSTINKELGQWKHLNSQTMTKTELLEFLKDICPAPRYKLREQARVRRSKLLRENNPMNEMGAKERARAKLRETWYGSEKMKSLSRRNMLAAVAAIREKSLKARERNLKERRWVCPCEQAFPTSRELYHHRIHCVIARQKKIERMSTARILWWERAAPEIREQHRRRVSESRKRQFAAISTQGQELSGGLMPTGDS